MISIIKLLGNEVSSKLFMNMDTVNCDIPHAVHKVYKWILRQYSIICLFLVLTKTIICLFSCFNWCFSILYDHHFTKFYSLIESCYFCLSNKYFWTNSLHWTFSCSASKSLNKVRNFLTRPQSLALYHGNGLGFWATVKSCIQDGVHT
jgi:hypothetical protein